MAAKKVGAAKAHWSTHRLHSERHATRVAALERDTERYAELLAKIGDCAHDHSTGPAVPDALWTIREMAYTGQQPAAVDETLREAAAALLQAYDDSEHPFIAAGAAQRVRDALASREAPTMTTDTKLLPLPERFSFMEWETHMHDYARANVAHATAPLQAEIEALRAKASEHRDGRLAALERAERLAEALRDAEEYINSLTPEWYNAGQRVLAAIRAALL